MSTLYGKLPDGATIIDQDTAGHWVRYRPAQGNERVRFKAEEAWTFSDPRLHGQTFDTEAGVTPDGRVEVKEGRNRAVAAALGDTIAEALGGVPDAPGWLDYEYSPIQQPVPLKPIRGMRRAQ
jgi:hypothetical protein